MPNWPLPGSAPVALLVVPTADPEALWAWPWGVGVAGSGPLPGHHQPRQGQKGFRRSSSQPGGPCLSRCGRNAAEWPLGLSLLVVVGRFTGSGQAHTPLGFKSTCDSGEGCAHRQWEPGIPTKSQPPRDPSSRYTNRGALIAENFKTPMTCVRLCSHYKGSVHFDMAPSTPVCRVEGRQGKEGLPHASSWGRIRPCSGVLRPAGKGPIF